MYAFCVEAIRDVLVAYTDGCSTNCFGKLLKVLKNLS